MFVPSEDLPAPKSLAEALQQRLDIYRSAAEGAKSKGDDRKARMHQRIMKVHNTNIVAHVFACFFQINSMLSETKRNKILKHF